MAIRAVLFDWNGTLFHAVDDPQAGIRSAAARLGRALSPSDVEKLWRRLREAGDRPEVQRAFEAHDRSAAAHRDANMRMLTSAGIDAELADAIYRHWLEPDAWAPYPDVRGVLERLRDREIGVGVVSDIGWDIRRAFARHGLVDLVSTFVLSFEHGRVKPDPTLFRAACAALGVEPAHAMMVGDSPGPDGGAIHSGIRALLLPAVPAGSPRGLDVVLELLGR